MPPVEASERSIFLDISSHSITAGYPQHVQRSVLIGATTDAAFNLIQRPLVTVGCALVPDQQFEFDSSLILPDARKAFQQLVSLIKRMPDCPLSVFGHADPVGLDSYNKSLSGRRATAVYALLTRDTELWEKELFKQPVGGDKWGTRSLQIMLNATGFVPSNFEGKLDSGTRDAVEAFQRANGLNPDRDPGPITRKQLFETYMDFLCQDERGQAYKVPKEAFLGAGEDPQGKAAYQGCSEFNPILLFSEEEHKNYSRPENKTLRNEANAVNRRVIVHLFEKGSQVDIARWPCPRAKEGSSACRKRFWSDGEERRSKREADKQRSFQESKDTFACRFYQRLADFSPCEAGLKLWVIRLMINAPDEPIPLSNRRYALIAGEGSHAPTLRGTTDSGGIIRIPVYDERVKMTLKLDLKDSLSETNNNGNQDDETQTTQSNQTSTTPDQNGAWEDEATFITYILKGGELVTLDPPTALAVRQRLYNLGYGPARPETWKGPTMRNAIMAFQRDQGLEPTGNGDEATRERLRQVHGS